jgi:hypothetical protein
MMVEGYSQGQSQSQASFQSSQDSLRDSQKEYLPSGGKRTGLSRSVNEDKPGRKPRKPAIPYECCLCHKLASVGDGSVPCDYEPTKQVATMAGARICKGHCRVHVACLQAAFDDQQMDFAMSSQQSQSDEKDKSPAPHSSSCRGFCPIFGVLHPTIIILTPLEDPKEKIRVLRQVFLARFMRAVNTIIRRVETLYAFLVGLQKKAEMNFAHWELLHSLQVLIRSDGGALFMGALMKHPLGQPFSLLYFMRFAVFPPQQPGSLGPDKQRVLDALIAELRLDGGAEPDQSSLLEWKVKYVDIMNADGSNGRYPVDEHGTPLANAFDADTELGYPALSASSLKLMQGGIPLLAHAMGVSTNIVSYNETTHTSLMGGMAKAILLDVQAEVVEMEKAQAALRGDARAIDRQLKTRHEQIRGMLEATLADATDEVQAMWNTLKAELPCQGSALGKERTDMVDQWVVNTKIGKTPCGDLLVHRALPHQVGRQEVSHNMFVIHLAITSQSVVIPKSINTRAITARPPVHAAGVCRV